MRASMILAMGVLMAGCPSLQTRPAATPEQLSWLASVNQEPLEFDVTKEKAAELWGKAQVWITQYSSMKIQIATDYVLQTFNPPSGQHEYTPKYGYTVTKAPQGEGFHVAVECSYGGFVNMFHNDSQDRALAVQNAHIFAHYLRTGDLKYPNLIAR